MQPRRVSQPAGTLGVVFKTVGAERSASTLESSPATQEYVHQVSKSRGENIVKSHAGSAEDLDLGHFWSSRYGRTPVSCLGCTKLAPLGFRLRGLARQPDNR